MHEQTCLSCFRQFRATEIFFYHRYMDNRVILLPAQHWNSEHDWFAECFENSLASPTHPFETSPRVRTVGIQCRRRCTIENCYVCSTTEHKYIKGYNVRNLSSDATDPDQASFTANSSNSRVSSNSHSTRQKQLEVWILSTNHKYDHIIPASTSPNQFAQTHTMSVHDLHSVGFISLFM